jgi:hypothetical protein
MLTQTACRNLKPNATPYKKSDGGGLRLLITPTGSKLWQLAYRFGGKQKTLAIGPYPVVTLVAAREKRDAAKQLLANGTDPGVAKQEEKRERAAARNFGDVADAFVKKRKAEGLGKKASDRLDRLVRYLKADFGTLPYDDCAKMDFRPKFLAFLQKYEKTGVCETVHRLRSTAEQIFDYGDVMATGINPARNLHKQLIKQEEKSRPALTDPAKVGDLFKTIATPFPGARFDDVVGLALRFTGYTAGRPGEVGELEWTEINFASALWTLPSHKVKMRNDEKRKDVRISCRCHGRHSPFSNRCAN